MVVQYQEEERENREHREGRWFHCGRKQLVTSHPHSSPVPWSWALPWPGVVTAVAATGSETRTAQKISIPLLSCSQSLDGGFWESILRYFRAKKWEQERRMVPGRYHPAASPRHTHLPQPRHMPADLAALYLMYSIWSAHLQNIT